MEFVTEINLLKKDAEAETIDKVNPATIGQMRNELAKILSDMESNLDERDSSFHKIIKLIQRAKVITKLNLSPLKLIIKFVEMT